MPPLPCLRTSAKLRGFSFNVVGSFSSGANKILLRVFSNQMPQQMKLLTKFIDCYYPYFTNAFLFLASLKVNIAQIMVPAEPKTPAGNPSSAIF